MNGPLDPISTLDMAAAQQHELYTAWIDAGFTEQQAFELLKLAWIASLQRGGGGA